MAELKFKPVRHSYKDFLAKAATRKGFAEAYDALALEYQLAGQMLKARSRAGLTQRRRCGTDGNNQKRGFAARVCWKACPVARNAQTVCASCWL